MTALVPTTAAAMLNGPPTLAQNPPLPRPARAAPFSRPYVPILTSPAGHRETARSPPALVSARAPGRRRLHSRRSATAGPFRSFAHAFFRTPRFGDKSRGSKRNSGGAETRRYENCGSQRRATRTHVRKGDAHRVCAYVRIYVYAVFTAADNVRARATTQRRAATRADTRSRRGPLISLLSTARRFDNLEINRPRRRRFKGRKGERTLLRACARARFSLSLPLPSPLYPLAVKPASKRTKNGAARYHYNTIERRRAKRRMSAA